LESKQHKNRLHNTLFRVGSFLILVCALPGCFFERSRPVKVVAAVQQIHEYQARFTDMPFPFDANVQNKNLVTNSGDKVQFFIIFSTKMSSAELQQLYHCEMEQLGWRKIALFDQDPQQLVLVFEKPTKLCVVTIELHTYKRVVKYHITGL
jgi:hypothetical protein